MLNENIKYQIREEFIASEENVQDYMENLEYEGIFNEEELGDIEEYLNHSCS